MKHAISRPSPAETITAAIVERLEAGLCRGSLSASYTNEISNLEALTASVQRLCDIVEQVSRERLGQLQSEIEAGEASPPPP